MEYKNYQFNDEFKIRNLGNTVYLVSMRHTFKLNKMGVLILKEFVTGEKDINNILNKVSSKYADININTLKKDINDFIAKMVDFEVIKKVE